MNQIQKKINYCRLSLHGGSLNRMELTQEHQLTGKGGGFFSYLAPVFDTMDYKSTFHRFTIKGDFKECKYEIIVAAVDTDISDSIFGEGITPIEQGNMLQQLNHVRVVNKTDFLLHELEGKYLWVYIGVSAASLDSSFTIDSFQVEFPKSSFMEYLPEVYQNTKDTFFYRYMAALQSLYVDMEAEIDDVPLRLDYETTPAENLDALAGWVGLDKEEYPYNPQQLRFMMKHLWELQAGKGTKKIMEKILHMLTGRPVHIVEYFKWNDWMQGDEERVEVFRRLYGMDESVFSVIIDLTGASESDIPQSNMIMHQIEEYMPLGMRCNLVYLRDSYHMDTHCYLDVNSYLSTPVTADTSGFTLGGNFVLG